MVNLKKLNKAVALTQNKEFELAQNIYSELLKEYPNDYTVLSFWGLFNLKRGQPVKAEKILELVYKTKKNPSVISALALIKYVLKKYDEAIIFYEELFRYDRESERIYQKIIDCFMHLKMYNFSLAYCIKYLKSHPDNVDALILIAKNYINLEKYEYAEEYCKKSIELSPENPLCWANAGWIQEYYYKDIVMANTCYEKARQLTV